MKTSEYGFVLFLIFGIIFLLMYLFTKWLNKTQYEEFDGIGTITRINTTENCNIGLYVDIDINGQMCSAQTDTYRKIPKNTAKGDVVSVKYYFTKKGSARCYITQKGFERVAQENKKHRPVLLCVSLVCFLISLFMLIM